MVNVERIEIDVSMQGHITNTYLIYDDENNGILIDPADNASKIIEYIIKKNILVKYIVVTHAHADHIGALEQIKEFTKAKILVHKLDKEVLLGNGETYADMLGVNKQSIMEEDILKVNDGDTFNIGEINIEIIHTPGHTAGCICIFEKSSNKLFTGDTIFCDCYGRTDLYSGNFNDMVKSIQKLFNRFFDITIYPGHDKCVNIDSAKKRIRLLLAMKGITI